MRHLAFVYLLYGGVNGIGLSVVSSSRPSSRFQEGKVRVFFIGVEDHVHRLEDVLLALAVQVPVVFQELCFFLLVALRTILT